MFNPNNIDVAKLVSYIRNPEFITSPAQKEVVVKAKEIIKQPLLDDCLTLAEHGKLNEVANLAKSKLGFFDQLNLGALAMSEGAKELLKEVTKPA